MSVRCTPFCSPCDKGYKHHELLLALLNTQDVEQGRDDMSHQLLNGVINKYKAKGWNHNTEILEENEQFRFPLLHWACVLGKIRTVQWLLDNGFSPTIQTKDTLETCIHRTLITLPDISSSKSGRISVSRFEKILPHFRDCLAMGNHRLNTPLHIAAQFMVQNRCYSLYENLFLTMLTEIKKMPLEKKEKCLNAQNASGDTVLNLLACCCKSLAIIEKLLNAGADSMIVNKLKIGPLDNAQSRGLEHIANFLRSSVLKGCGIVCQEYEKKLLSEESRKRRSERRSTYNNTLASLSMFCRAEANDLDTSHDSRLSTYRGLEKSSRSTQFEELDNPDSQTTEDEDSTCQSSSFSSVILRNIKDKTHTTVESNDPLEKSSPFKAFEQQTKAQIKQDDGFEMCTCREDDGDKIFPNANHTKDQDATGWSKNDLEPQLLNPEVKLFDVMKEAGVLPNLTDVITKTKKEHLSRIDALEKSMNEIEEKQVMQIEKEKNIEKEVSRKKRELEKLKLELVSVRKQKATVSNKRKLMEEESQDLRKKLICCETLLKTVPKDTA